jgi:hypothetical protein
MDCKQEMTTAEGCTIPTLVVAGTALARTPWGKERHWSRPRAGERCGDCGVLPGKAHHLGCDIEECPRCGRQLLSCDCLHEGDDED